MKPLEVYLHEAENESVRITRYDSAYIESWEKRTAIGDLYKRWTAARSDDCPPTVHQFKAWGDGILRADVRSDYPFDFKLVSTGRSPTVASLRRVYDTESRVIQQQFFNDLLHVKETATPLLQTVEHRFNENGEWNEVAFARVLLPVVNHENRTVMIYSTTRPIGAPTRIYVTGM